jgi:tRNA (cmo5U34)-methyltransferase
MSAEIDKTVPGDRWAFNADVTDAFDDMLKRSIPQYDVMRSACFDLGRRYVQDATTIVDLGCSRGEALDPFVREFGAFNTYVGVEVSEPMLAASRERFASFIETRRVDIRADDLRTSYPPVRASLTLCVLTLQFTPIEYRQRIVRDVFRSTVPGGAMILVEKVLGSSAEIDAAFIERYYALKSRNGYDSESIERKRLSLEGVLVPVTARWNDELLRGAGFNHVDCFWRYMNFAGWLAVRES